jgi:hypothetical protein
MNTEVVKIGDKNFNVELCDYDSEREYINRFLNEYDSEVSTFDVLWELRESTREEIASDVDSMRDILERLEHNPQLITAYVEDIRKKKNGMLWKNSGVVLQHMAYCCEYFTDFTNAWSTPELRLDVVNETTCKLSIRHRTYTNS